MDKKETASKGSVGVPLSDFLKTVNTDGVDLDEMFRNQDDFLDGEYKKVEDLSELI